MEIRTLVKDAVDVVKKNGVRVILAGALMGAMASVKPVSADGIGQANCDIDLTLANPNGVVDGVLTANKAEFIVKAKHISDSNRADDNVGPAIKKVELVNYGAGNGLNGKDDINPTNVTTHSTEALGVLNDGSSVFTGEFVSDDQMNLTVADVTLADDRKCMDVNNRGSEYWKRAEIKRIMKAFFPAIDYDSTVLQGK